MELVIWNDLLSRIQNIIFEMFIKCEVYPNNRQILGKKLGPVWLSQRVLLQVRKGCLKEAIWKGGMGKGVD